MSPADDNTIDANCYLQIVPDFGQSTSTLRAARVARMTQRRPEDPIGGSVMVRLTLRVPKSVLLPLRPAVVKIPENHAEMTVEVVEP